MREQHQRPGSGEAESFCVRDLASGPQARRRICLLKAAYRAGLGWGGDRWSHFRGSDETVMFRDSLREASNEVGKWVVMLTWLAGGPTRGDLAHGFSFGWCFPRVGWISVWFTVDFHPNLGTPNCGTRHLYFSIWLLRVLFRVLKIWGIYLD
jgi:hypothetical protein